MLLDDIDHMEEHVSGWSGNSVGRSLKQSLITLLLENMIHSEKFLFNTKCYEKWNNSQNNIVYLFIVIVKIQEKNQDLGIFKKM